MAGLAAIVGCQRKDESVVQESGPPAVKDVAVVVEQTGDVDPIADAGATRGGTINTWGGAYPKSLNMWLDYNSFSLGVMALMFEPLAELHATEEKPVGVLADSWNVSEDGRTFTFTIHPAAKWSDGKPVTADDVQFFYDVMMDPKNLTSLFRVGLKRFSRPEVVDSRTVRVTATEEHWNNFWEAANMVAFPKHAWEGKDFNQINFEFPVVSGPYELAEAKTNRYILLKRRGDWWGRVKRYNNSKYNFDHIRFRSMEDREKALEALKKGDFDLYAVYTAKIWAQQTHFEQVKKGWILRTEVYNKEPRGFQGLAMNLRRPLFEDKRVREALCLLLDRELMNNKLMFNQYFLLNSYYPDLYEKNVNPQAPFFKYEPDRARALLQEAGWNVNASGVLEKDGKPLSIVFLHHGDDLRHLNIYLESLKAVGIQASIDQVSLATFRKRVDSHDFDMIWAAWGASRLRDPEPAWDSSTAMEIATNNVPGVKDPAIDALIKQQKTEPDLAKRNEILRQLDVRLVEIIPYVLLWQSDSAKLLYWNKFGTPKQILGKYGDERNALVYWWLDKEKEKQLAEAMKNNQSLPLAPEKQIYSE